MTMSRTSRIMLGFLLLSLAAFLWVNFVLNGPTFSGTLLRAAPAPSAPAARSGEQAAQRPEVAAPTSQVARDLEVLDLPFLVTEPPAEMDTAEEARTEAVTGDTRSSRRATVNPFSPILQGGGAQAAAAEAPAPAQAPAQEAAPQVTNVPVPAGPPAGARPAAAAAAAPPAPKAPAPAAVTPESRQAAPLPRALPSGTLGGTPELLRSAIGAGEVPSGQAARMAALREPSPATGVDLQEAGEAAAGRASEPEPLQAPVSAALPDEEAKRPRSMGSAPLAAGTSALSRYLRDNNVRFTGSVIGPVSVGVFRSSLTTAPVVISLGQTLPDTSIVLTDLRGQQAEFTLGDTTHTLTLELRR